MNRLFDYGVYVFDCDGVIFNTNELKAHAMQVALSTCFEDDALVFECISYFRENFGKSRFHHIKYFLEEIFNTRKRERPELELNLLRTYSFQCREMYCSAELVPGFLQFLKTCPGEKYVASGSEQSELREAFDRRGLSKYFSGIYGSPTEKSHNVRKILAKEKGKTAVMIGDAMSDMNAARQNGIDFVFYSRFSNVKKAMLENCRMYNYKVINDYPNAILL